MLENNSVYSIRTALQALDESMSKDICHDCNNCPLAIKPEIAVHINGHKYDIWCYGVLLTDIRIELDSAL